DLMGGEIGCRNNPGGGATFWFSLPLVPGKAPEASEDVEPAAPSPASNPRHVLVVEDDAVSRTVAVRMLERMGFEPDSADNGAEAVELASRRQYPLILMDCRMPDVDGYEAARRIRKSEPRGSHAVIIALTASTLSEDRQACIDAGMDDYLTKPIDLATLTEQIHRWLPQGKVG
ncbi:MAG: response regulator, partial [bacterium]|nr:response regulator [bacterium]